MTLFNFLQADPTAFITLSLVLGLIVGSFLNVVIYRLPVMLEKEWQSQCRELLEIESEQVKDEKKFNLSTPASRCPHCGHAIRIYENIPVLSYLFLRGKCSSCKTPISMRYPIIELISGILTAVIAWHFGYGWAALAAMFLTWSLIALTMIDYDHQLLPDNITLPFLWLGLSLSLFNIFTDTYASIIGAIAGYLALWLVFHGFKLVTGKEGMGYGDFKLLAMLGAWMGWQMLPAIILMSSVVGVVVGVSLILFKNHNKDHPIPFGPYLAIAGWICLIWGDTLNQLYLGSI